MILELKKWEDEVFFSTVRLCIEENGEDVSVATGFLLGIPITNDGGDDQGCIVVVSNRHAFADATRPIGFKLHSSMDGGQTPNLGTTIPYRADFSKHFVPHPDERVDLACIGVTGLRMRNDIFQRHIGPAVLAEFNEDDLYASKEVCYVGYPDGQFDFTNNLPIMRFGHIATIPTVDFRGVPEFLIDAPTFEGSSGSAVYAAIDGRNRVIGVLTRALKKYGDARLGDLQVSIEHYLDMGVVVKATMIRQLIDHVVETRFPGSRIDYGT